MENKSHYEGSESTKTNHYHFEKDIEYTEYKEALSTTEDSDISVKK